MEILAVYSIFLSLALGVIMTIKAPRLWKSWNFWLKGFLAMIVILVMAHFSGVRGLIPALAGEVLAGIVGALLLDVFLPKALVLAHFRPRR